MGNKIRLIIIAGTIALASSCGGDKKDAAQREEAAKQAIQQGAQKEKAMMEGMVKGVETMEKKMAEEKEPAKK